MSSVKDDTLLTYWSIAPFKSQLCILFRENMELAYNRFGTSRIAIRVHIVQLRLHYWECISIIVFISVWFWKCTAKIGDTWKNAFGSYALRVLWSCLTVYYKLCLLLWIGIGDESSVRMWEILLAWRKLTRLDVFENSENFLDSIPSFRLDWAVSVNNLTWRWVTAAAWRCCCCCCCTTLVMQRCWNEPRMKW